MKLDFMRFKGWLAIAAIGLLGGCASTPQASLDADAAAKEFQTHPSASTIYVYRSEFNHHEWDTVLYLSGRLVGATLPGAFFRIDTVPGRHTLHGAGPDAGQLMVETRPGQIYFVSLIVMAGNSYFDYVSETVGRDSVRACCVLYENWQPGQRPLFR